MITASSYRNDCHILDNSNALYLKLVMGNVTDYFKPDNDYTYCDMLTSHNRHLWSYDGENWERPKYCNDTKNDLLGGSAIGGFYEYPWDERKTLSFWGGDAWLDMGGCCHCDYNDTAKANRAFTLEYGIGKRVNRHF